MSQAYEAPRSYPVLRVIGWWELRRILYNLILVVIFFSTYLGFSEANPDLAPGEDAIEPMAVYFVILPWYFGIANACYTAGWITELSLRAFKVDAYKARKRLFWGGIIFSCLITSVPFWMACYYTISQTIFHR